MRIKNLKNKKFQIMEMNLLISINDGPEDFLSKLSKKNGLLGSLIFDTVNIDINKEWNFVQNVCLIF